MNFSLKGLLPLMLFLALCGMFAVALTFSRRVPTLVEMDRSFPEFTLPDLFSDAELGNEYFEGQVTLVNIFGSWCKSCVVEHPTLMKLARDEGIIILGVDWNDTIEAGRTWLERGGNPYARTVYDTQSILIQALGVTGAPETFIVDKKGQLRYKYVGPITQAVWREQVKPAVMLLEAEQ